MKERVSKWITPIPQDPDQARWEYTVSIALLVLTGFGLLFTIATTFLWLRGMIPATGLVVCTAMLSSFFLAYLLNRRGWTRLAALLPVVALFLGMSAASLQVGIGHSTLIGFAVATSLAGLLLGLRPAFLLTLLGTAVYTSIGWLQVHGHLTQTVIPETTIATDGVLFAAGLCTLIIVNWSIIQQLNQALHREQLLLSDLQARKAQLEQRVADRTAHLVWRSAQLEAATKVAREIVPLQEPSQLLDKTVQLISQHFGYYHSGIFLLDATGKWAVLQAASSEGGQHMLARGYRLRVGQDGPVGYVLNKGEPRIALDVDADAASFDNFDLADTRSEIVLPLTLRGEVIGALDMQSHEPAAFDEEDLAVFQTLADQVAMTINNAWLFQKAQEGVEAERRAYSRLSHKAWANILETQPGLGYRYEQGKIIPLDSNRTAPPTQETGVEQPSELPELTLSVEIRGHQIASINAHKVENEGAWTAEEVAVMETLAQQLGQALESARLYQDTQRRAAREQVISTIAARVRETLDIETVLKTAASEMRQALGLKRVVVRLAAREAEANTDLD